MKLYMKLKVKNANNRVQQKYGNNAIISVQFTQQIVLRGCQCRLSSREVSLRPGSNLLATSNYTVFQKKPSPQTLAVTLSNLKRF